MRFKIEFQFNTTAMCFVFALTALVFSLPANCQESEVIDSETNRTLSVRVYPLLQVRERIQSEMGLSKSDFDSWIEQRIVEKIGMQAAGDSEIGIEGPSGEFVMKLDSNGVGLAIEEEQLYVVAAQEQHQSLQQMLSTFREYGLRQVVIKCVLLRATGLQYADLPIDWTHVEAVSAIAKESSEMENDSTVMPALFTSPDESGKTRSSKMSGAESASWLNNVILKNSTAYRELASSHRLEKPAGVTEDSWTHATSVIERAAPVLYTLLNREQLADVLEAVDERESVETLMSPSLLVFSGQTATVSDASERPFVTGIKPVTTEIGEKKVVQFQPNIRVYPDGKSMKLRPVLRGNQIELGFELKISSIRSVDSIQLPRYDGSSDLTVQVPEVAQTVFSTNLVIPVGYTMAVCALEKSGEGQRVATIVLCTCETHDFDQQSQEQAAAK
ncbi:MAG: hypothetical protein ACE361_20365 [Aureliella sp.]